MSLRRFAVGLPSSGRRLDKFLAAACPDISRSRIQQLIEAGAVAIGNAVERRVSHQTRDGDVIEFQLPDEAPREPVRAEAIPLDVLFEDGEILVLNKPAGLVVHPAPGHASGTLVNAILHHCRGVLSGGTAAERPGIVHRLDRDTSGVLLVAKTDRAHESLARQMKKRTIEKDYLALCAGRPPVRKGDVALAIGRDPADRKKMKGFRQDNPPAIRAAKTLYQIEEEWPTLNLSLLRLRLVTGRTHQIRVHLASIGCPIVGDPTYGHPRYDRLKNAAVKKALSEFPRQALHAETLSLSHPVTGERLTFTASLPDDLRNLLEIVRQTRSSKDV